MLRKARPKDLEAIRELMNENIRSTTVVYHYKEREQREMERWYQEKIDSNFPVFVVEQEGVFFGYGRYEADRPHAGFGRTVEHSIYVKKEHQGQGVGARLLDALIRQAQADGYHVMLAYIDGENQGSIRLHEKKGFQVCGHLREVGYKFGRYRNLVIMERLFVDKNTEEYLG